MSPNLSLSHTHTHTAQTHTTFWLTCTLSPVHFLSYFLSHSHTHRLRHLSPPGWGGGGKSVLQCDCDTHSRVLSWWPGFHPQRHCHGLASRGHCWHLTSPVVEMDTQIISIVLTAFNTIQHLHLCKSVQWELTNQNIKPMFYNAAWDIHKIRLVKAEVNFSC